MGQPLLITHGYELAAIALRLSQVPSIALDVEANGMHAYRPRLCTMQLAWREGVSIAVAIVDALEVDVAPLAPVLGSEGPLKLLHDLTFDARMLHERGIALGNVRDTSVAARFLGESATGLSALLSSRLGETLSKELQNHDWAERPFTSRQLDYLAGDVRHLHRLDETLQAEVDAQGIGPEVAVESAYKLATALAPPRDTRPAHHRIKGYRGLLPIERAVLRELVAERERLAELLDRPAHKIAPSGALVALARSRPQSLAPLRRHAARFAGDAHDWLAAIRRGAAAGTHPEDEEQSPEPISRREIALRRDLDAALARWRRVEASRRRVDPQVILPGHCMRAVSSALAASEAADALLDRLKGIEGICAGRVERYGEALVALGARARGATDEDPSPR